MMMGLSIVFFKKSSSRMGQTSDYLDNKDAQYDLEAAHSLAVAKLERALEETDLIGRLRYVGGPVLETFNNLSNAYATNTNTAMEFLRDSFEAQSYSAAGVQSATHEFRSFATAFPVAWTDPNPTDNNFYEYRYTFEAVQPQLTVSPQQIIFDYSYRVEVRAYGGTQYSKTEALDRGTFNMRLAGRPFSQWVLLMHSMRNQNGSQLVFAGGNTSNEAQEVYGGPVHVNERPAFYGHPAFLDLFTSAQAEPWTYFSNANYTGCPTRCPTFQEGKIGSVPAVSLPTEIFNTLRLAAGDPSTTAATNNTTVTEAQLAGFLANHATGTIGGSTVAAGIYIPTNSSRTSPTGGIFVKGDAEIKLNVVQGSADFGASYWANIAVADRACKFQKININHLTAGVARRDIFVADEPCNKTYVFNFASPSTAPQVLTARINGNIHVDGSIQRLGGESRTRPAIARDFGFTISALRDVRIDNDIQYEDATYVSMSASGVVGTTAVANAYGPLGGSGIQPTAADLAAKMEPDSRTVLGILSAKRNVLIRDGAPANINIHASIFAGNSAFEVGGLGCGINAVNRNGCGFGYEGWNTRTGMGTLKFYGGLSEYRDQTTGVLSSPLRGYSSRWAYDTRLRNSITPPAFPVSDTPQVFTTMSPMRAFRMVQR